MIAGPDGDLWFTEAFKDRLGKSTRDGQVTELPLPASLDGPLALARGVDGSLWLATRRAVAKVVAEAAYDTFSAAPLRAQSRWFGFHWRW
jgi:streptogramin lyase